MAVYQSIVLELRKYQREPARAQDYVQKDEHAEAVLHFVVNSTVRAHPFDSVCGRQHQAEIDHDGEGDTREHDGDSEPAYGLLSGIGRATHGGLVRLEGEVREDRGNGYAECQAPDPGRVVAVLSAIGHPEENVARSESVPHVVAQSAEPEEGGHQGNVHDCV